MAKVFITNKCINGSNELQINMKDEYQINDIVFSNVERKRYVIKDIDITNNKLILKEDTINIKEQLAIIFDTNIIIDREGNQSTDETITLFKYIDEKLSVNKWIYQETYDEINRYKTENNKYKESILLKLNSYKIKDKFDFNDDDFNLLINQFNKQNDKNEIVDNKLLYLIWNNNIDILITNDKNINRKANLLGLSNRVFTSLSFLEYIKECSNKVPDLKINNLIKIENIRLDRVDYRDEFFNSFREEYKEFNKWFDKKQKEGTHQSYVIKENNLIKAFLFLQIEDINKIDKNINFGCNYDKVLKISSLKSNIHNLNIGERFLYISFQWALINKINLIYVTFYYKKDNVEKKKLKILLEKWGFVKHKELNSKGEIVYYKNLEQYNDLKDPKFNYPLISRKRNNLILPIKYYFHYDLFPDLMTKSEDRNLILQTEKSCRYSITKYYICSTYNNDEVIEKINKKEIKRGDNILIYRMGRDFTYKKYTSEITGEAILESINYYYDKNKIKLEELIKYSIYTKEQILDFFKNNNGIIIIKLLYNKKYNSPIIRDTLLNEGIVTENDSMKVLRTKLDDDNYRKILKLGK